MKLKLRKKDIKADRGITLIALVITIIVLLILAGITIVTLTGDNGILTKVGDAKNKNTDAEIEEEIRLAWNSVYPDSYLNNYDIATKASKLKEVLDKNGSSSTVTPEGGKLKINYRNKEFIFDPTTGGLDIKKTLPEITAGQKAPKDSNAQYKSGNYTAIIPAGFTVSNEPGESSIETGLVIRDDDGNEFVWIPVNIPWKSDSSKTITLARYEFKNADDETAGTILQTKTDGNAFRPSGFGFDFIEEGPRETGSKNAVAKNINDFISKTNSAGGFWIGRYEARVENWTGNVITHNSERETNWTGYTNGKLVEKPEAQVFYYITQNKASELSRNMYSDNNNFESDLINSYAWDTATLFLQEYDNRTYNINTNSNYKVKYSYQGRLSEKLKYIGSNNLSAEAKKDKICNVYDMADNCFEWTTETAVTENHPCVWRGGVYTASGYRTCGRFSSMTLGGESTVNSFRPLLYVK